MVIATKGGAKFRPLDRVVYVSRPLLRLMRRLFRSVGRTLNVIRDRRKIDDYSAKHLTSAVEASLWRLGSSGDKHVLVIDFDSSAFIALEEVNRDVNVEGDDVVLCGLRSNVHDLLTTIDLMKLVPNEFVVGNRTLAVKKADMALNQNDCQ